MMVWFKGGLISHAAKYDHLDAVGALNGQLSAQMRDLRRELADINLSVEISLNEYSGGTRVLDFFFDNIFTDLSVRDRVRDDMSSVETIIGKLRQLESELNRRLLAVQAEIRQLDRQIEKAAAGLAGCRYSAALKPAGLACRRRYSSRHDRTKQIRCRPMMIRKRRRGWAP